MHDDDHFSKALGSTVVKSTVAKVHNLKRAAFFRSRELLIMRDCEHLRPRLRFVSVAFVSATAVHFQCTAIAIHFQMPLGDVEEPLDLPPKMLNGDELPLDCSSVP